MQLEHWTWQLFTDSMGREFDRQETCRFYVQTLELMTEIYRDGPGQDSDGQAPSTMLSI